PFDFAAADPVTIACRGRKSENELNLMRLACEATFDVFRAVFASLREGMTHEDIAQLVEAGFSRMNLHGAALVLIGASGVLRHGIGLDGHQHPYLVRRSKTVLEPGMTFSNEPGIYVPSDYGLRCEDDMVISADGPAQLLTPGFAPSLEKPFA